MSVKAMAAVFDASGLTPTEKLVLLALADHASEDGLNIYPSVETIAKKTGLTDRTVRRTIKSLKTEDRPILFLIGRKGRLQNEYGLNLQILRDLTQDQVSEMRPDTGSGQDLTDDPPRPDTGSAKPSEEPSDEPSGKESAARPRRQRDPNLDSPAVIAYRDVMRLTPNETQRAAIVEKVSDCDLWRRILTAWSLKGHNPRNVAGQLDAYSKGGLNGNVSTGEKPAWRRGLERARARAREQEHGDA